MSPLFIEMSPKCLEKMNFTVLNLSCLTENINSTKYYVYNNCSLYVKILNEGLINILLHFG